MAKASKDFKTTSQKFKAGDTVPDEIAKEWPRFIASEQERSKPYKGKH